MQHINFMRLELPVMLLLKIQNFCGNDICRCVNTSRRFEGSWSLQRED